MTRALLLSLLFVGACAGGSTPVAATPPAQPNAPATPAAPSAPASTVREVDAATLKADLDRGAVPLLIDVRTAGEYAGGHVPGAKNVPLDQLEARIGEFGTAEKEVYVICAVGGRSAAASSALASKGLHPVNVKDGTSAWKAAGYPLE